MFEQDKAWQEKNENFKKAVPHARELRVVVKSGRGGQDNQCAANDEHNRAVRRPALCGNPDAG